MIVLACAKRLVKTVGDEFQKIFLEMLKRSNLVKLVATKGIVQTLTQAEQRNLLNSDKHFSFLMKQVSEFLTCKKGNRYNIKTLISSDNAFASVF